MEALDIAAVSSEIGLVVGWPPPLYFLPPEAPDALPACFPLLLRSHVNGGWRLLRGTQITATGKGKSPCLPHFHSPQVFELASMSVVPPNRSQTGWPRGVNQFGNKYIQQTKPLTLERTINL